MKNKLKMNEHIEINRFHGLSKKKNQNRARKIICSTPSLKRKN